jgi:hypothetical protein
MTTTEYPKATYTDGDQRQHQVEIVSKADLMNFYKVRQLVAPYKTLTVHVQQLSNISMPDLLPHRFRESSFRKYEEAIRAIVQHHPEVQIWCPTGSTVTFACRLRDAMASFLKNAWKTTVIDHAKFANIYDDITVSEQQGKVFTGGREKIKQYFQKPYKQTSPEPMVTETKTPTIVLTDLNSLESLCDLLSKRCLSGPFKLEGFELTDELISICEQRYDVAFVKDEKGLIIT